MELQSIFYDPGNRSDDDTLFVSDNIGGTLLVINVKYFVEYISTINAASLYSQLSI